MKCEAEDMIHWQTAAYYQAGYKREYPYGYEYPGEPMIIKVAFRENISTPLLQNLDVVWTRFLIIWHFSSFYA